MTSTNLVGYVLSGDCAHAQRGAERVPELGELEPGGAARPALAPVHAQQVAVAIGVDHACGPKAAGAQLK